MLKKKELTVVAILAVILAFALFGNGISGDFVFDDTIVIIGNPFIGDNLQEFWHIFISPYFAYQPSPGLYRPLTIASYSMNAFMFGQSPASFHVINILLHAIVSILVFILVYKLVGRRVAWGSFLLFMFLPIHVEAITSVVGRAEILSLLFVLGALICVLGRKYAAAAFLLFLGLLSKEIAIAFLPIFLFVEADRGFKQALRKLVYFIPTVGLYAILRFVALGRHFLTNDATQIYNPIKFSKFLDGIWTSFKVFYLYLEKTFYPVSFSSDYSFNQIPIVSNPFKSPESLMGMAILFLFVILLLRTRNRTFRLGIIFFLSAYFIISNWVFKTGTIMAERLMYMPSVGLAILAAALIENVKINPPAGGQNSKLKIFNLPFKLYTLYFILFTLFAWYGWVIIDRNKDWLTNKSLYESAYAAAPNSVVNRVNQAYLDFTDKKYIEAEKWLNEILVIAPDHVPALNLAGQNYKKMGQYHKAEELWKKAIEIRKDYLRAYLSLGVLYYENGYFRSVEKVLTEAVNIYPRWSEILFLSLAKISLDKPGEAIELIQRFSGADPSQKELRFALGLAYFSMGNKEKAFYYFEKVKDPNVSMDDFVKTFDGSRIVILGEF